MINVKVQKCFINEGLICMVNASMQLAGEDLSEFVVNNNNNHRIIKDGFYGHTLW